MPGRPRALRDMRLGANTRALALPTEGGQSRPDGGNSRGERKCRARWIAVVREEIGRRESVSPTALAALSCCGTRAGRLLRWRRVEAVAHAPALGVLMRRA